MLDSMTIRLMHVHLLETSTYVMGSNVNLEDTAGVKRSFFQYKWFNSSMLHSMTIEFIHMHALEPLYLRMWWDQMSIWGNLRLSIYNAGSNVNLDSIWGQSGRVRRGGGALTFFSGRGVRPGFPKYESCKLITASKKWVLRTDHCPRKGGLVN